MAERCTTTVFEVEPGRWMAQEGCADEAFILQAEGTTELDAIMQLAGTDRIEDLDEPAYQAQTEQFLSVMRRICERRPPPTGERKVFARRPGWRWNDGDKGGGGDGG